MFRGVEAMTSGFWAAEAPDGDETLFDAAREIATLQQEVERLRAALETERKRNGWLHSMVWGEP
jgi:hypothetical protein